MWQRFISADVVIEGNLFTYCKNAAVNQVDYNGKWGTHTTPMPVSFLIDQLLMMLNDGLNEKTKWKYNRGQRYRNVDCIGMICYCAEQYFTKIAYKEVFNVRNATTYALESNMNEDELVYISSDSFPPVGSIVYNNNNSHVGVYLGFVIAPDGSIYEHAVVQCSPLAGVNIKELEDTEFKKNCTYNYIMNDLPPGVGTDIPISQYTVIDNVGEDSWD